LTDSKKSKKPVWNIITKIEKLYKHTADEIFVKINTRLGSKLSPRYKKETVKENHETTIITTAGRKLHKSNIKNI